MRRWWTTEKGDVKRTGPTDHRPLYLLLLPLFLLLLSTHAYALDLNYWIEPDASGNPSKVWVKVPSIPANSTIIIYAKKETGYSPNGEGVFIYFHDFSTTSGWSLYQCTISDGVLSCTQDGSSASVETTTQIPMYDIRIVAMMWSNDNDGPNAGWDIGFDCTNGMDNDGQCNGNWYLVAPESAGHYKIWKHTSSYSNIREKSYSIPTNSWFRYETVVLSGATIKTWIDETLIDSYTDSSPLSDDGGYLAIREWEGKVDWIFVAKAVSSEPTISVSDTGEYYEITITNPNSTDLTNYQVAIPASDLGVSSTSESIHFSDTPFSNLAVSITHTPTAQSDLALDPENNVTEVNVTHQIHVTSYGIEVTEANVDGNIYTAQPISAITNGSPDFTAGGLVCHGYPDYVVIAGSSYVYPSDEVITLYVDFTIDPNMDVDNAYVSTVFGDISIEFGVRVHLGKVQVIGAGTTAYQENAIPGQRYRFLIINSQDGFKVWKITESGAELVHDVPTPATGFANEGTIFCTYSSSTTNPNWFFKGTIHQVTIWHRVLSPEEINALAHGDIPQAPQIHTHLISTYTSGSYTYIRQGAVYPTSIVKTYSEIGDYNFTVFVKGYSSDGTLWEANATDTVHIDMYPQNLTVEINSPDVILTTDKVSVSAEANDNGTLTYSYIWNKTPFYYPPGTLPSYYQIVVKDADAQGCINPRMAIYYDGYIYVACWSRNDSSSHAVRLMKLKPDGTEVAYRDLSGSEPTNIRIMPIGDKNYLVLLTYRDGYFGTYFIDPSTMQIYKERENSGKFVPLEILDIGDNYYYVVTARVDSSGPKVYVAKLKKTDLSRIEWLTYSEGYFNSYPPFEAKQIGKDTVVIRSSYAISVIRITPSKVEKVAYLYRSKGGDDTELFYDPKRRVIYEMLDYDNSDNLVLWAYSYDLKFLWQKIISIPYITRYIYRDGIFYIIGQDTGGKRLHIYTYNPETGELNETLNYYHYYLYYAFVNRSYYDRRFFPMFYNEETNALEIFFWNSGGGGYSYFYIINYTKPKDYTYAFPEPGTYTLTVRVTDDVGLSKEKTITLKVYPRPYEWEITPYPFHVDEDVTLKNIGCPDGLDCAIIEANTDDQNATITKYSDKIVLHFLNPLHRKVTYTIRVTEGNKTREVNDYVWLYANYITLSITVKNEDDGSAWDTSTVDLTRIEVWDDEEDKYIGKKENANSYSITNLTRHHLYRVVLTIQGSGITYTRTYYVKGYDMSLTAYAINPTDGIYFTHGIKDPAGNPLEGFYDQILKYVNNAWITLSDIKTSVDGTVSLFIRPATYYKVRVLNSNREVVKEFTWFADPNVRTVYITVSPDTNIVQVSYETAYDRIQYQLLPEETQITIEDNTTPPSIIWKVSDTEAGIKWFSMKVEKQVFPLGPETVFEQNVTDHPEGGEITYTPTERGVYKVTASVYVDGADEPFTIQKTYIYGSTGIVGTAPKNTVSGATLLILGIIIAAIVVGWAAQYDPVKAGLLGLGVLAILTIYAPWVSIGGIPMWAILTLAAFTYLFLVWLGSRL